jgi:small subunit ribosomal protein S2
MTNLPKFTIQELIEAGVHYGHKTMRWNPKMAPYIYGERNSIHIIDLQKTAPLLKRALAVIYEVAKDNGRILFVGTKMQASEIIEAAAQRSGQYYINHRWLGGMLTNFGTVSKSIRTMIDMEQKLADQEAADLDPELQTVRLTKKERLDLSRKVEKLRKSLGGIREMGGRPDLLFVIDTNKENLAIQEANKLGIPVIAIIDSNSNPDGVDYPVPGNDDAIRSINLYCDLVSEAILAGMKESLISSGADVGEIGDISAIAGKAADKKHLKGKAKPAADATETESKPALRGAKAAKETDISAEDVAAISAKLAGGEKKSAAKKARDMEEVVEEKAAKSKATKAKKSEDQ